MVDLSSKQRVRRVLAREVPDRVPIDYNGNAGIDGRLMKHFGLKEGDHLGLLEALHVDSRGVGPRYTGPKLFADLPEREVNELWGYHMRWIEHGSGGYWDYCDFPLRDATLAQIEAWPQPNPDHFDYDGVRAQCKRFAGYGLCAGHAAVSDIINTSGMLRTMEQVLIDLADENEACLRLIDRRLELQYKILERTLSAAAGAIDFVMTGEDLGTQIGPMISLPLFRKVIRPRHQKFVDLARHWKIPVMIHSCGSSSWAFDDFIEMGISAVDTLQPEAKNMAPAYLKQRYGGHLAFHGCISTAGPVAFGSVEETVRDARAVLETMMPGGGYWFAPTHALQDNSPTENVLALYQCALEHGRY